MNKIFVSFFLVCLFNGGVCLAQAPAVKDDLPLGPWISAKLPDFARWDVEVRYSDAASRSKAELHSPRLRSVVVTKTRNIKQQKKVYDNGLTSEQWIDGTTVIKSQLGSNKVTVDLFQNEGDADLPEFGWLTRTNYIGKRSVEGQDCLLFQAQLPALKFNDPDYYVLLLSSDPKSELLHEMATITAAVNPSTKLPVSLQINSDVRLYTFLPSPTEMLVVPPQFAAVEAQSQARFRDRNKPLPTP